MQTVHDDRAGKESSIRHYIININEQKIVDCWVKYMAVSETYRRSLVYYTIEFN